MSGSFSGVRRIFFEMPEVGDDRRWNVLETRLVTFFEVLLFQKTKSIFSFPPFSVSRTNFLFTVSELFFIIISINSFSIPFLCHSVTMFVKLTVMFTFAN